MLIVFFAPSVYANSAEPPMFVIYSPNAPKDTEIFVLTDGGEKDASMYDKRITLWETSFFIDFDSGGQKFLVRSSEKSFELDIPSRHMNGSFSSFYTLDFKAETLTENISPLRAKVLVGARVLLTLLIECGFYFLVKYRAKRSYAAFITVNLITQTFLNVIVNSDGGSAGFYAGYIFLVYLFAEFFVFIFEMVVLPIAINEKKKLHTALLAFAANAVSMYIGGLALIFVPF